jgi:UPF0755 protein
MEMFQRLREFLAALSPYIYRFRFLLIASATFAGVLFGIGHAVSAPPNFPAGKLVEIEQGVPFSVTARSLEEAGIVRSGALLSLSARATGTDSRVAAGIYKFDEPLGLYALLGRLERGERGVTEIRITFTEGMTVRDMASLLEEQLPNFDTKAFLTMARGKEGYLFPDTYFFEPTVTPEEIVTRLSETFTLRVADLADDIEAFERPLDEVMVMASLLEKEARSFEVRQTVAGILWKRIELEMPLQVDAVFGYIYGRPTFNPSLSDLEIDSPYNTYRVEGLPPGPIGNPGLESIRAAVTPIETDYLYYLTDRDGIMRYARTFEEHIENRRLYLD